MSIKNKYINVVYICYKYLGISGNRNIRNVLYFI